MLRWGPAALCLGLAITPAAAQVTFDPRALAPPDSSPAPATPTQPADVQPSSPPKAPAAKPRAPARPSRPPPPAHKPPQTQAAKPVQPAKPAPPAPPVVPPAPPPLPVIPPPIAVPARPPMGAPPPHIVSDAPGAALAIPDGLRLTFGADSADLNPAMDAAVRQAVRDGADGASFTVTASAAETPDDPSVARRLALSRAESVRNVLIDAGVPSVRIYPKVVIVGSEGIPDRADLIITKAPKGPTPP